MRPPDIERRLLDRPVIDRAYRAYPFFPTFMWAGATATLLMQSVSLLAMTASLPTVDYAELASRALGAGESQVFGAGWWAGAVVFFVFGTFFLPLVYVYLAYFKLPGTPAVKGLAYGFLLWCVSALFGGPACGMGIFFLATPEPMALALVSIVTHLVYGLILGSIAKAYSPEILELEYKDAVDTIDDVYDFRKGRAA